MAGKRIATVAGTSAEYFLDRWLTYQGIDPDHVKLNFAEPGLRCDFRPSRATPVSRRRRRC